MVKTVGRPPRSEDEIIRFRQKIAAAALAIYKEEGFEAVSMRRLSRDVGCSATTLYAHFDGKTEILMQLWDHILAEMGDEILKRLTDVSDPLERLKTAAIAFVTYWVENPDHFRLVFMSNDVSRPNVDAFLTDTGTEAQFQIFRKLVGDVMGGGAGGVGRRADGLISSLIGACLCYNTIRNHPWPEPETMVDQILDGVAR
ncbi:MAG: TetR/AcrR family transcriptional regulator [Pseudomonadota bacterium]